ncbi:DNA/RNA helicase domain-containing protein [Brachybacterium paraconglomeratum]|uniref:DNA/RNA helicase domain-containing protein n=1 Tax=Brachybacterium paraconglomeratum TaxID=173362 RepID=UPI0038194E60
MTAFEIEELRFTPESVEETRSRLPRFSNWPVVYLIEDGRDIYVGETGSADRRMRQHLKSTQKEHLKEVRIVFDERFNGSACLDLESLLIRLLGGDGKFEVLNRNEGITNQDYYQRSEYNDTFKEIFEELRSRGYFERTIPQIENSDLFKLSPYKALNTEQGVAVLDIMEGLIEDLDDRDRRTIAAIQGDPGTGKTIVGIYLMKLMRDLGQFDPTDEVEGDSMFSDLFVEGHREKFQDLRIGLVVPQKSLRKSISKVFRKVPALRDAQVLTPYDVADAEEDFDVIVVDEAHRLTQRGAQAHGTLTKRYRETTERLFGADDLSINQLDWIRKRSRHTILLLDTAQSVRPIDIEPEVLERVLTEAHEQKRLYPLDTQMRVKGGKTYLEFARSLVSDEPPTTVPDLQEYEFELFDDLGEMHQRIRERDAEHGLARLVAGYAWKWRSKGKTGLHDIELDGVALDWNVSDVDWIASKTSLEEVGSIHTVQGYDLNYAGVIVGGDLRLDPTTGRLIADRDNYFDAKGKADNKMRGQTTSDEDLLRYITNVYRVLLTRGMRGTYLYVVDPDLRDRVRSLLDTITG